MGSTNGLRETPGFVSFRVIWWIVPVLQNYDPLSHPNKHEKANLAAVLMAVKRHNKFSVVRVDNWNADSY
jgi:hypothetical protein